MSKKKIAFYIESMVVGGAEKVLIDLVNNLDQEKYEVTVIAIFKKSVYSDYQFQFENGFKKHVKYKYLIDNTNVLIYRLFNYAYNNFSKTKIYNLLIREKYDIEVAFYEGMPTIFVAHSTQKSIKIAWLHIHQSRHYGNDVSESVVRDVNELYSRYNQIIGVSNDVCHSFQSYFNMANVKCLYNPLDENNIRTMSLEPITFTFTQPLFVTVGRLTEQKGYIRLLNVIAKLKKEGYNFKILMLGEGHLRSELTRIIDEEQLSDYVTLIGNISNPYPYIKNADCLIMSSYEEGLSTVVVESLILGTPVITTDCTGMKELVTHEYTGLIDANSEEGIYNNLKKVLNHPKLLLEFRANISIDNKRFTLKSRIEDIEQFL